MKRTKKIIAVALCASVAMGSCSCAGKFEDSVSDAADSLGKAVVGRDYKKISKLASDKDDKLEEILSLTSDDSSESDNEAREIIASTLSYEVDDDSYEGDFMGKEGSIDVVFTYVDYESVTEDVLFPDITAFQEAIDGCKDTVEVTITFDFEKDGGDAVCTNIGDIADLFPYADEEFNFALSRDNYAGSVSFENPNNGSGYENVPGFTFSLPITGDGQQLSWEYYYTVDRDGSVLLTSDTTTVEEVTEIGGEYMTSSDLTEGTYTVTFYTADGDLIASGSVEVTYVAPTPSPTPTSAPSGSSTAIGSQFICPDGDSYQLPGTDIVYVLPDGYHFCDENSSEVQGVADSGSVADYLLLYSAEGNVLGLNTLLICDLSVAGGYQSSTSTAVMDSIVESQETAFENYGSDYTLEYTDYDIAGTTYTAINVTTNMYGINIYYSYVIIGDSDSSFLVSVIADSEASRDTALTSFELVE